MNKAFYITTFLLGVALCTQAQTEGSRQRVSTGTKTENTAQTAPQTKETIQQTPASDRRRAATPADTRQENKQAVPDSAARHKRVEE